MKKISRKNWTFIWLAISNYIISHFGVEGVVNDRAGMMPNEILMFVSAGLTLFTYLPLIPAGRYFKRRKG